MADLSEGDVPQQLDYCDMFYMGMAWGCTCPTCKCVMDPNKTEKVLDRDSDGVLWFTFDKDGEHHKYRLVKEPHVFEKVDA